MESSILSTLGQIAGIGGLGLGVLLLLFRDVIRKNIFPRFKDEHLAYRLLRMIVAFTFTIAVVGIAAWLVAASTMQDSGPVIGEVNWAGDLTLAQGDLIVQQYQQTFGTELGEETRRLIERASNLVEGGLDAEALKLYQGLASQLEVPALRVNLAILQARSGNAEGARENLVEAIASDPSYAAARVALSALEAEEGRFGSALRYVENVSGTEAREIAKEIREREASGAFEIEPNDDAQRAGGISLGSWVQGSVSGNDRDVFRITLPPGNTDWIDVQVEALTPGLTPELWILDRDGAEIWSKGGRTQGQNLRGAFVGHGGSDYFVEVRVSRYDRGSRGPYRMRLVPWGAFDSFEPNDTDDRASPIALGTTIAATILWSGDVDAYRFTTRPEQDKVRVQFTNQSSTLWAKFRLVDPKGGFESWSGSSGASVDVTLPVQPSTAYVLRIGGDTDGAYSLLVSS